MDSPWPFCFINDLDNEAFTPGNGAFRLGVRTGGLNESTALVHYSVQQEHGSQQLKGKTNLQTQAQKSTIATYK